MDQEYLAFVDEIGRGLDEDYLYRLDFTYDKDSVWGDFFNAIPAITVPDLQPDINSLSSCAKISSPKRLELAKKNGCFSMQDCIDGIISLCFSEIDSEPLMSNKHIFRLDFGDEYERVEKRLENAGLKIFDKEEYVPNDSAIDTLIDNLDNDNNLDPEDY